MNKLSKTGDKGTMRNFLRGRKDSGWSEMLAGSRSGTFPFCRRLKTGAEKGLSGHRGWRAKGRDSASPHKGTTTEDCSWNQEGSGHSRREPENSLSKPAPALSVHSGHTTDCSDSMRAVSQTSEVWLPDTEQTCQCSTCVQTPIQHFQLYPGCVFISEPLNKPLQGRDKESLILGWPESSFGFFLKVAPVVPSCLYPQSKQFC